MATRDTKGRFVKGHKPWHAGKTMEEDERIKAFSDCRLGEKSYHWKGGRVKHPSGAIRISKNGKQFWEHHYVWCVSNNFPYIPKGFEVHHINEDNSDNRPENLVLLDSKTHRQLHYYKQKTIDPSRDLWGANQHLRGELNGR